MASLLYSVSYRLLSGGLFFGFILIATPILRAAPEREGSAPQEPGKGPKAVDVLPEDKQNPKLDWKMVSAAGVIDVNPYVRASSRDTEGVATRKKKDQDGKEQSLPMALPDPKMFMGGETFYCEIPAKYNHKEFVLLGIDGVANERVEAGTVLNVNGAILGFRKAGAQAVEIVARSAPNEWRTTGIRVRPKAGDVTVAAPTLSIRFNRAQNTWDLFARDILMVQNLPLSPEPGAPRIVVRASAKGTDTAMLRHIRFADAPSERFGAAVRTTDGKLDLKKAYDEGALGVHKSGAPVPPQDTAAWGRGNAVTK